MGCLTIVLGVIGGCVLAFAIGPIAYVLGVLVAVAGIAMAMVTKVK